MASMVRCMRLLGSIIISIVTIISATSSRLDVGVPLQVNDKLVSDNGLFSFVLQNDGNICGYNQLDGTAYWCSYQYHPSPAYLIVSKDCTLQAYSSNGDIYWSSSSTTQNDSSCFLTCQSDRNIVLYTSEFIPVWSCANSDKKCELDIPRSKSLEKNILFGYQGWFATSKSGLGWVHWSNGQIPSATSVTFDLFPDVSDFSSSALDTNTNLTDRQDGSSMALYDSLEAVDVHFSWMSRYGINGVIVQRFVGELSVPSLLERRNKVLLACRDAAEKYNKVFAVEYDISGADPSTWSNIVLSDWKYLADTLQITSSPSYQHEQGKPVVMLFGIGFTEHPGTPSESLNLINTFKSELGCYFVGGVPTYWRDGDADSQPGFADTYAAMDTISPWLVGRYSSNKEFQQLFNKVLLQDISLTTSRGQRYAPTIFPGFSWTNVQRIYGSDFPLNQIPRNAGSFWEYQANAFMNDLASPGAQFIFGAMFDEFDEGTGMAKAVSTSADLPAEGTFLYLSIDGETLPSDYYLLLAGKYSKAFNAGVLQSGVPLDVTVVEPTFDIIAHKKYVENFATSQMLLKTRKINE